MGQPPAVHCGVVASDAMLEMDSWRKRWTETEWVQYLADGGTHADVAALRQCTHTGRPLGTSDFVAELEKSTLRLLAPRKGGRPKQPASDSRQLGLTIVV